MNAYPLITIIFLFFARNLFCLNEDIFTIENFNYENFTLENGMEVFLIQSDNMQKIFHSISYAMNDKRDYSEHEMLRRMMLHSLVDHPKNYYVNTLEALGIEFGSKINPDSVSYYSILQDADDLATIMQFEIQRMNNLAFSLNEFEVEKKNLMNFIESELHTNITYMLETKTISLLLNNINNQIFLNYEKIKQMEIDRIKKIYYQNYSPCYAKLIIIGNFNIENVRTIINNLYKIELNAQKNCNNITINDLNHLNQYDIKIKKKATNLGNDKLLRLYNINSNFNYFAWEFLIYFLTKKIQDNYLIPLHMEHKIISNNLFLNYFTIHADSNMELEELSLILNSILSNIDITEEEIKTWQYHWKKKYLYRIDNFKSFSLTMNNFINSDINIRNFYDIISAIDKVDINNIKDIIDIISSQDFAEVYLYND